MLVDLLFADELHHTKIIHALKAVAENDIDNLDLHNVSHHTIQKRFVWSNEITEVNLKFVHQEL